MLGLVGLAHAVCSSADPAGGQEAPDPLTPGPGVCVCVLVCLYVYVSE